VLQKSDTVLQPVLPKSGLVVSEKGGLGELLCKPKILPLKSATLKKLEQLQVGVPGLGNLVLLMLHAAAVQSCIKRNSRNSNRTRQWCYSIDDMALPAAALGKHL
jgi:hypothetical protein